MERVTKEGMYPFIVCNGGWGDQNQIRLLPHFSLFLRRISSSHSTPGRASLPDIPALSQTRHLPLQQVSTPPSSFQVLTQMPPPCEAFSTAPPPPQIPKASLTGFCHYHSLPSMLILHRLSSMLLPTVAPEPMSIWPEQALTKHLLTERMNE